MSGRGRRSVRDRSSALLALLLAGIVAQGARARADELPMLLDVSLNHHSLNLIGNFQLRNGVLVTTAKEWRSLGIIVPAELAADDATPVAMTALPGVRGRLDTRQQTLELDADASALIPRIIEARDIAPDTTVDRSTIGAILNYNLVATQTAGLTLASGLLDTEIYGTSGVFDTSQIVANEPDTPRVVRLNTTYTYSDPDKLRRIRAGDILTSGLAWTRTLRLGGVQFSSDFTLQPNLVTFPVPTIRGSVAVPSTVDLLINGVREFSQQLPAGAFELHQIPVVTGASNVAVVVRDAQGQESIQNLPFYTSNALLKSGLTSYGGELGAVRRDFGFASDLYGSPAANASVRHGFSDWLTGEAHGEATQRLGLAGIGASLRLGDIGVLTAAGAFSKADRAGVLYSLGFSRQSGRVTFNASTTRTTSGYRDIAIASGDLGQRSVDQVGVGLSLGHGGFLGLSYNAISYYGTAQQLLDMSVVAANPSAERILSATYSVQVHRTISFYATGFAELGHNGGDGFTIGFSIPLGNRSTAGGYMSSQRGSANFGAQASQSATDIGDVGWNINMAEGSFAQRQAELDYRSPWGQVGAGIDQLTGTTAERLTLAGAVVAAGGGVFPTNTIQDSFAVVRAGSLPGIPVLRENRVVGTTDGNGRILVPDLRAYQSNTLAIDPLRLPVDVQVGQLTRIVRPADRSGVLVDFAVRRGSAARISLVDPQSAPLPVGAMVSLRGGKNAEAAPVGFDGTTYLTDLPPDGTLDVALPDGSTCATVFKFTAKPGQIPLIGPLTCHQSRM